MNVQDLIDKLRTFPADAPVSVYNGHIDEFQEVEDVTLFNDSVVTIDVVDEDEEDGE